ncbi:MAG: transposase [Fibrobacteres bacterium]|nr:transposase [Fibrobacterota bacterium]
MVLLSAFVRVRRKHRRDHILRWCEQNNVGYVVGVQPNSVLEKSSVAVRMEAEEVFFQTAQWQKLFDEVDYRAGSWKSSARVIGRANATHWDPIRAMWRRTSRANRATSTPRSTALAAKWRIDSRRRRQTCSDRGCPTEGSGIGCVFLMSTLAYVLQHTLRAIGLKGEKEERSTCSTIRIKLLKIGAVVTRNTRRIRLHLSSNHPDEGLFRKAFDRLALAARLRGSLAPALG